MNLGVEVGRGPGHIVLDGDPASPPQKGHSPQFSTHVYCAQTAGWIKMALGLEVLLGPGHVVLDGDPAPPPKNGTEPPQFSAHVYCGQTAAWIKMKLNGKLGTEVGRGPGTLCYIGTRLPLPQRGTAPNFRPMSIVAKRLDGSRWHLAWKWALVQATLC